MSTKMLIKLIFLLLFGSTVARINHKMPSTFRRSSVESVPISAIAFFQSYSSSGDKGKILEPYDDTFSLANSRYAVEKVPTKEERAEEHFPIRDAVEKVPPISEYLENFISNTLQKQTAPRETSYRMVCFLPNWSYYRKGDTKFTPDYVDPNLCTHIVYAYAALSPENYTIIVSDPVADLDNGFYKKITSPEITSVSSVLISIGGWTDSSGDKYSKMVSTGSIRRRFVNSVIAFLRRYGFRGLHFDWQYPVCWQARCSKERLSDRTNFVKLIQELRQEFDKQNPPYELAIGISGYKEIINESYDILNLSENTDFLTVTSYDYHGAWENRTGHLSPLYPCTDDPIPEYNTHSTMSALVMRGADPKKLVMGVPLYGQSFTLADSNRHEIGDDSLEPGEPGEYTQQPGILSYGEICVRTSKQGWQSGRNPETGTESYAFKGNQWVGFDDRHSLRKKINYLKKSGYGGVMAWTIDLDDFNNDCCTGIYPLLQEMNVALGRLPPYPGVLDCSKPVIIPIEGTCNSTEITPGTDEEFTYIPTTASNRPWSSTKYTTRPWTTTSKYTTRPWTTTKYPTRPSSTTKYPLKPSWNTTKPTRPPASTTKYPTRPPWTFTKPTNPSVSTTRYPTRPPWSTTRQTNPPWSTTKYPTSVQLVTSSEWWPPNLTDRPTRKPKLTTKVTYVPPTSSTKIRPTRSTWKTTTPVQEFPDVPENPEENDAEETTPPDEFQCVDGKYYQDPINCNSYFQCVFGQKRRSQCPPGLHWNHKTQNCDWPSKATCWERHLIKTTYAPSTGSTWPWAPTHSTESVSQWWPPVLSSRPSSPPKPSTDGFTTTTTTSTTTPSTLEISEYPDSSSSPPYNLEENESVVSKPSSEKQCENGKYYQDPYDCGIYYFCVYGKKKKNSCPSGLHFNPKTKNCDWPSRATCNENVPDISETSSVLPSSSSEYPMYSSTSSTTQRSTTWWTWTEKPSSTTEKATTTKQPWWTSSETPWSESTSSVTSTTPTKSSSAWWTWSETPSTSWEWTPSTTTAATLPTTKPPQPISGRYKVVCYFTNWAWYRPGSGKYLPEDTDPNLCTHIVYGFTVLDFETLTIRIHDSWADVDNKFFERVAALKKRGVRVTVAVGGWNDSAGDKYSRLVNNPTARANFISSALRFMNKYGFEGLDLDWEYPVCWQTNCNKGPASDKEGFSALVTELREAFDPHNFLLSAAVSPNKMIIDKGYNVPLVSEKLDWIAVMTYDFHGQWDKKTGHVAPIYHIPGDDNEYFNVYYGINYWIKNGADPRKVILGMPMYGQGFTLSNQAENGLNAPASGPSLAGPYTRSAGFLAYYEICQKVRDEQWTVVQDVQGRRGPYAYRGDQWVGYDDIHTIKIKINLIKKLGLGGGMIWALDLDDFRNVCGDGHYPLLTTIARGLSNTNTDYEIDNSFVTGVSIPWSSLETSSIPSVSVITRTTKRIPTRHPTRYTKSTTRTTTTTPTTPITYSTEASSEFNEFTEDNHVGGGAEWSSTSTTTSSYPEPISPTEERFKVVCYFTNWAWYRQGKGKYMVNDIDSDLCTHLIYAFAVLDSNKLVIKPHDSWADIDNQFYEKFVELKKRGVKVLLAIGGWNDSAGNKYSRLVNSKSARSNFISHVVEFLKKYNFDGLDVDWEYPKCWQVNCKLGPASDKKAFADFISELREVFDEHGLLLSAAVSPNRKIIDAGYDIPLLSEKLDWISVMVYDYHGQWDEVTGHVAPMYEHPDDADKLFNANASIHYWVQKGANPRKIIMGMPMYGQSFTLASTKNNSLNARAYGGGEAGESTRARGFLSYYEICERILRKGWDVEYDVKGRMGPYARRGNQWVSFDDQAMIRHKSQYVLYNNLGGAMIWALDLDDFRNTCNCGSYPLLKTINKVLRNYQGDVPECSFELNSRSDMKLFYQNEGFDLFNEHWKFETCEHGEVKKHPTDCTKYLMCAYGVYLQEQSCAIGLHFSEKRSTCDWPESANCKPTIMEYAEAYFLNNLQKQTLAPIISKPDPKYKVMCYLTNWSAYRYNNQLFPIQALDNHLCTHIIYGFVMLDPQTLTITSNTTFNKLDNDFFKRVRVLKETGVKISLALGGWYDSQENKYSRLVSSKAARAQFIKHTIKFLQEHDFDGLEIDWEYPRCWQVDCSRGPVFDKSGFVTLLRELKESFWKNNLLLSAAVSMSREIMDQAYEVPEMFSYVDWLSLMAYDYHGYWEGKTDHIAPLYQSSSTNNDDLTVDSSVSYWLEKGAPAEKLILGLPLYGQSFTLKNATSNKVGSKVIGPGNAGRHTRVPGFLAFYEICEMTSQGNWKTVKDKNGHYTYMQDQWISYNDVSDIRAKGKYIKENNLGGALVWSLDLDDFVNVCGCGPNPLLFAINDELSEISHRLGNTIDNCT